MQNQPKQIPTASILYRKNQQQANGNRRVANNKDPEELFCYNPFSWLV